MRNKIKYIGLCLFISLGLISGCGLHSMDEEKADSMQNASGDFIAKGTSTIYTYSVSEAGIFYIGRNQTRLMYYDYETDTSYVLCSTSGCRHSNDSCPAYVGDCYRVYGFAYYNGKVYLLKCEKYGEDLKLIEMDVDGQNQRTVASFEWGDATVGTWQINSVMPVYYCGNHAIMEMDYSMNSEDKDGNLTESYAFQLVMVNLESGDVIELTDKIDGTEQYGLLLKLVSSSNCIFSLSEYDEELLGESEFYEQYGNTESYSEYYNKYYENIHGVISYFLVDLETEEKSVLWTEDIVPYYLDMGDGELAISDDAINMNGLTGEWMWISYLDRSDDTRYSLYNIKTGEEKYVCPSSYEFSWMFSVQGSCYGGNLYNDGDTLLCFQEDDEFRLYKYSLLDQTMEEIVGDADYQIWGATESKVIGSYQDSLHISWLSKADYEAGNMDARVSISLDW